MVDKKACKVRRKRKYKVNGAIFATRITLVLMLVLGAVTIYKNIQKNSNGEIVESSAYIDENGISSMVSGVENGGVYTSPVVPQISSNVKRATLTRDGEKIRFKSGKKISKNGSYILTLEDKEENVDTIYFDIEY